MDIVFSSTTELAAAIRSGRVSAVDVLDAHLKQIEKWNPALNAVVTLDAEGAYQRAHEADKALACEKLWGPLHGVPFTLKDALATAGMRTTTGFPPLADYVPHADSTAAARLKAAGGILMGKTNVPVLLADYQTDNPIFGRTNNPWNTQRTPGGSSGGAAAAVASGMTPFDIGTDLSGSIRIPAAFCGLFGLKPTERRVSLAGLIPGLEIAAQHPHHVLHRADGAHGRRPGTAVWDPRRAGRSGYRGAAGAGRSWAKPGAQRPADRLCANLSGHSGRV